MLSKNLKNLIQNSQNNMFLKGHFSMGRETWLHCEPFDIWNTSYSLEGNNDDDVHIRTNETF